MRHVPFSVLFRLTGVTAALLVLAIPAAAQGQIVVLPHRELQDDLSRWTYDPAKQPALELHQPLKFGKLEVSPTLSSNEVWDGQSKLMHEFKPGARASFPLWNGWKFVAKGATTFGVSDRTHLPTFKQRPALVLDDGPGGLNWNVYQEHNSTIMFGVFRRF
jgi:hypothetical protein